MKARQIRRRIKSVQSTQQITKTMEMVAAAKIKKAQARIEAARPYALKMVELLEDVSAFTTDFTHPLLEKHEPPKKSLLLLITSNRGLCGSFNSNLIKKTDLILKREKEAGLETKLGVVGRKGINYYRFAGPNPYKEFVFGEEPSYFEVKEVADFLIDEYVQWKADRVILVFNHFKSLSEQRPIEYRLLPIGEAEAEEKREARTEFLFEPKAEEVLSSLLPIYIETLVFRACLESAASEQAARRLAMKNATDNAEEMIKSLTLAFNKARQAQITQEIAEISTCAEAIKYIEERKRGG